MYWKFGKGTTWTHSERITEYWSTELNPYGPDLLLAEIIFSTGRKLPEDVVMVHELRSRFWDFRATTSITLSYLEFIDRFGADTSKISSKMVDVSRKSIDAKQLYLDQEFGQSFSLMGDAIEDMESLMMEALRLKDQTLVWTYAIEWLAVTGVLLVTGFSVWTLMVKRRLYREVSVTRMLEST
jgi:hypothetical protein